MLSNYKKWTGKQREASYKITKKAMKDGVIPYPTKCNRCGQTEGRIDYHSENYDDPINGLEPLCMRCHLKHHREYNKLLKYKNNLKITYEVSNNISKEEAEMRVNQAFDRLFEEILGK